MPSQSNTQAPKKPLNPQERMTEAGLKAAEKKVQEKVSNELDSGAPLQDVIAGILGSTGQGMNQPSEQDILSQVTQLSQMQVPPAKPSFSNIKGIFPALVEKLGGGRFDPFAQRTQPLGFDNAVQLMNLRTSLNKEERQAPKDILDIVKTLIETQQLDPGFKLEQLKKEEEIKGAQQVLGDARKNFNEAIVGTVKGFDAIDKVREAAVELGDFSEGTFAQIGERIGANAETFARNPKYTKFEGVVNQTLNTFARDIFGEKGPLANEDIARTIKGIGADKTVPLQQKLDLLDSIQNSMATTFEVRQKIADISDSSIQSKFPKLAKKIKEASKRTLTAESAKKMGGVEVDTKTKEVFDKDGNVIGRLT